MTSEENIKVLVRIRPNFNDDAENNLSKYKDSNSINISLSERDSFKNELKIVKISKDFLNDEIQKKIDSSLKQKNDDDKDNDDNKIKNAEIFKNYENKIKELQDEIKKSTYNLAEVYGSYQDLKVKHDDSEDAILYLEERIIDKDEQISYLNECLSSEETKYENALIDLEKISYLKNNAKENEKKIIDLKEKLENQKKTINEKENEIAGCQKIIEEKDDEIDKLTNNFNDQIEKRFVEDFNMRNHLEEVRCLKELIGKDLECPNVTLANITLALNDLFIKTGTKSESIIESIKQLDIYVASVDSKNDYLSRLSSELINSNEQKASLKKEYDAISSKYPVLPQLNNCLINSSKRNSDLITKITGIGLHLLKCDRKMSYFVINEVWPD